MFQVIDDTSESVSFQSQRLYPQLQPPPRPTWPQSQHSDHHRIRSASLPPPLPSPRRPVWRHESGDTLHARRLQSAPLRPPFPPAPPCFAVKPLFARYPPPPPPPGGRIPSLIASRHFPVFHRKTRGIYLRSSGSVTISISGAITLSSVNLSGYIGHATISFHSDSAIFAPTKETNKSLQNAPISEKPKKKYFALTLSEARRAKLQEIQDKLNREANKKTKNREKTGKMPNTLKQHNITENLPSVRTRMKSKKNARKQ